MGGWELDAREETERLWELVEADEDRQDRLDAREREDEQ